MTLRTVAAFGAGLLSGCLLLLAVLFGIANLASDPQIDPDPERVE